MDESPGHRHYSRELPRFWIVLPVARRRSALEHPLLASLFPSHAGYFPRARGHRIRRAAGLTSTIFNYCVSGSGSCSVRGVHHEVGTGDLMVIPAGESHAYGTSASDPWTLHWFHAMGSNVPALLEQLGATPESPVVHLGRAPELEALFTEVRETLEDDQSDEALIDASLTLGHLFAVMLRLRRSRPRPEPSADERVRKSLEWVARQLGASHTVDTLAALAGLSPSRYSALVRSRMGCAPKEYLKRLRMRRAAELLKTTDVPVKTIAREVGFGDALHFSRVFRQAHGRSPRAYREARRAKRGSVGRKSEMR
jgi:AraC-like DNA-binding protein